MRIMLGWFRIAIEMIIETTATPLQDKQRAIGSVLFVTGLGSDARLAHKT